MARFKAFTAFVALAPLLIAPIACGDDAADERSALEQEELGRELDLALQGDTLPATFEDTLIGAAPEETRGAPEPQAAPRRTPQPAPQRETPRRAPERTPEPAPAPQPRVVTRSVPAGTSFAIRLNETLSTGTSRAGDRFTATLSEPIYDSDGSVLIESGATVHGVVTGVQESGRVGETAVLKLAFESVSVGGRNYGMQASVVEANPQRQTRTSTQKSAAKIGAGAAAGAILGRVLGKDTESTLKGAAIGAAAGTAIAMGTADVDAVLPSGSRVVIRLDAPVEVRKTIS